jgi:hypothetical protein
LFKGTPRAVPDTRIAKLEATTQKKPSS